MKARSVLCDKVMACMPCCGVTTWVHGGGWCAARIRWSATAGGGRGALVLEAQVAALHRDRLVLGLQHGQVKEVGQMPISVPKVMAKRPCKAACSRIQGLLRGQHESRYGSLNAPGAPCGRECLSHSPPAPCSSCAKRCSVTRVPHDEHDIACGWVPEPSLIAERGIPGHHLSQQSTLAQQQSDSVWSSAGHAASQKAHLKGPFRTLMVRPTSASSRSARLAAPLKPPMPPPPAPVRDGELSTLRCCICIWYGAGDRSGSILPAHRNQGVCRKLCF